MSGTSRLARRLTHTSLALAVSAIALQAVPAMAAEVASPVITGPDGTSSPMVELTWTAVDGAATYEVRVDNDPSFATPEWSSTTASTIAVPTELIGIGQQHVQVRAKVGADWSPWATADFTVEAGPGPVLTSPANGAQLDQPANPPLLVWTPVTGAASYAVEIDTEAAFVSPTTYTTKANTLVVPDNQIPGVDYFWRVRATLSDGVATEFSTERTYELNPIAEPTITAPGNTADVTDVVLDWNPVPGARFYELEVDDDFDFSSKVAGVPAEIYGTRFSPKVTFGNDQYFWRVRAVDLDGNNTPWVDLAPEVHYTFDRVWRDTPQLVYPYDGSAAVDQVKFVKDDLYYQWKPVPHATQYEVWVSTDPNFTDPSPQTKKCVTAGTTYTPGEVSPFDACMPGAEGVTYYWKVRPFDLPFSNGIAGIFSETQRFVYGDAEAFTINTPQPGATVRVPTLDWDPVPGTETYEVKLVNKNGKVIKGVETHSTSYTLMGTNLAVEENPFHWEITALDEAGRTTTLRQVPFTFSADPLDITSALVPVATPATYDAPLLRWGAMAGANYYEIHIGNAVTGNEYLPDYAPILSNKWYYPAATDLSIAFLNEGTYTWRVVAYDENEAEIGSGPASTFTVKPLEAVTGHQLALTGKGLDAPGGACATALPALCEGVPASPVLDWTKVTFAAHYRVWLSRDGDFTSGILTASPPRTVNTRWAPRSTYVKRALEDSQAQTPYYWYIQPCKSKTQCGPDPRSIVNAAEHAFKKTSPKVELLSPPNNAGPGGGLATTEITFTWQDYLTTNLATSFAATGEPGYQAAKNYEIQIADEPTFADPLDAAVVDQPTYTSANELYPEGPLYWRVQAIDAADNRLGWTATRQLIKTSPKPVLTSPLAAPNDTVPVVSGGSAFRWQAQPFAGTYEIQVAANADRNFSAANLVVNKVSKRSAFSTGISNVKTLQASPTSYVWRVRRVDPLKNAGPWSAIGEFKVALAQPALLSPAADAVVGTRNVALRWAAVTGAAKYRVEYRKVGATSSTATTTPATAFVPASLLTAGTTYEWRVASVDAEGRYTAPEQWRRFTVGGTPSATTPASIQGSATFQTTLTAVPPTWNVPGVVNTFQWTRDGVAIAGATGSTYVVTADDVTRSIRVVVTGTSPGFGTGTSTSEPVVAKAGPGPVATTAPKIAGSAQVGSVLTSTDPTWNPANTASTRQWLRSGQPITGAIGSTYTVTASDLNEDISLRVTGSLPGREPTTTVSNSIAATLGPAVSATSVPVISGTPQVGQTLTSSSPTWDQQGVQESRQWLRNGLTIAGATSSSYVAKAEDMGASLSVTVTGRLAGRADGVATSAPVGPVVAATTPPTTPVPVPVPPTPVPVPPAPSPTPGTPGTPGKISSSTTLTVAKKLKASKRGVVTIKVTVTGLASPTGLVKIMAGGKVIGKVTLTAAAKGIAKVKLKKLKKGKYKLTAVYAGGGTTVGSTSKARSVKVV